VLKRGAKIKSSIVAWGSVGLLLVLFVWIALEVVFPTYTHRYRLIGEVEINGKTYSGSSVFKVSVRDQSGTISALPWATHVVGDAVFIDLDERGALLIPNQWVQTKELSGESLMYLAQWAFKKQLPPADKYGFDAKILSALSKVRGVEELQSDELPQFVWLRNVNDQSSAQVIRPSQFSQLIGGGANLKSVKVEMTYDAPTRNSLWKKLPWLSKAFDAEKQEKHLRSGGIYQLRAQDILGDAN
jgi:hypothetical protein